MNGPLTMASDRLDTLARSLAGGTRRALLTALATLPLGGRLPGRLFPEETAAEVGEPFTAWTGTQAAGTHRRSCFQQG